MPIRVIRGQLSWDFPFLPVGSADFVKLLSERFELFLPLVPDDIDLGVVGDRLEGDVRHALIDEAMADV